MTWFSVNCLHSFSCSIHWSSSFSEALSSMFWVWEINVRDVNFGLECLWTTYCTQNHANYLNYTVPRKLTTAELTKWRTKRVTSDSNRSSTKWRKMELGSLLTSASFQNKIRNTLQSKGPPVDTQSESRTRLTDG